jgi:hypothetical protein
VGGAGRNGRRAHESMEPGAWGWAGKAGLVCLGTQLVTGCLQRQWAPDTQHRPPSVGQFTGMLGSENKASAAASSWLEVLCTRCTMFR